METFAVNNRLSVLQSHKRIGQKMTRHKLLQNLNIEKGKQKKETTCVWSKGVGHA